MTIIFESGAVQVLKVTDKIDVVATETNDFGACCVAWSPKGKQMVIGKGINGFEIDFYRNFLIQIKLKIAKSKNTEYCLFESSISAFSSKT